MNEYRNLMNAIRILETARDEILGSEACSPAWEFLYNAVEELKNQARVALRADPGTAE
jgi:hypothetical protein